jgi:hypothetical protein
MNFICTPIVCCKWIYPKGIWSLQLDKIILAHSLCTLLAVYWGHSICFVRSQPGWQHKLERSPKPFKAPKIFIPSTYPTHFRTDTSTTPIRFSRSPSPVLWYPFHAYILKVPIHWTKIKIGIFFKQIYELLNWDVFRLCSWCFWKALDMEGCMGLVPWCLDLGLQCKSSWILNDYFSIN